MKKDLSILEIPIPFWILPPAHSPNTTIVFEVKSISPATSLIRDTKTSSFEWTKEAKPTLSFSGVMILERDCAHNPSTSLNATPAFVPCNLTVPLNGIVGLDNVLS